MSTWLIVVLALAVAVVSCSAEREWRDPNRVLSRAPADDEAPATQDRQPAAQPLQDGVGSELPSARDSDSARVRPRNTDEVSVRAEETHAAPSPEQPAGGPNRALDAARASQAPARAAAPSNQRAPVDLEALTRQLSPFGQDPRLWLSSLSVGADGSAQLVWPRFSPAVDSYVAPLRHDTGLVTILAAPARPQTARVSYRGADGWPLSDADPDAAGLQMELPNAGVTRIAAAVAHGGRSRRYALQLVRTAPPNGEPACAAERERAGDESVVVPFRIAADQIVADSSAGDYFVLYAQPDSSKPAVPISLTMGQGDTTVLADPAELLGTQRLRIERYRADNPADIDGDCIDDLTELLHPSGLNPLNPAAPIRYEHGVVAVPDQRTFSDLAYSKEHSPEDFSHLKFVLLDLHTERPRVYFINSNQHRYHVTFREALGLEPSGAGMVSGTIVQHPGRVARDGQPAGFHFEFWPYTHYRFEVVARAYSVLAATMPLVSGNLVYYVPEIARQAQAAEAEQYRRAGLSVVFDEQLAPERGFVALNPAVGYGLLRLMPPGERPGPREVVIYEAIPNELPRVAGIITTVAQTPLSHVNLRAVQDGVPNAYVLGALESTEIADYLDKYVRFEVAADGWNLREASLAEVEAFHASSRPTTAQAPERDLSVRAIRPLAEIEFEDWTAFGVKAANLAVLGRLGLPDGTVPDGFAVPFHFYHEFMRQNDFYRRVEELLRDPEFRSDLDLQREELGKLRKLIRSATMPRWMLNELRTLQESYPEGTSIRCRSSTNNEDLPGFSGAGLYDSRTQHPDEGHIAKCIKQVYASLWNFRAFAEREFHRVDHLSTAMAVLTHPNYSAERANGVAVSFDPVTGGEDAYYANVQLGEDLVTNPMALSTPEELLLRADGDHALLASSNRLAEGVWLLTEEQRAQLRDHLEVIHEVFREFYAPLPEERFTIEIEFKITWDNRLAIKQARPWVFTRDAHTDTGN